MFHLVSRDVSAQTWTRSVWITPAVTSGCEHERKACTSRFRIASQRSGGWGRQVAESGFRSACLRRRSGSRGSVCRYPASVLHWWCAELRASRCACARRSVPAQDTSWRRCARRPRLATRCRARAAVMRAPRSPPEQRGPRPSGRGCSSALLKQLVAAEQVHQRGLLPGNEAIGKPGSSSRSVAPHTRSPKRHGITDYLATKSAGQCGPRVNGLSAIADTLQQLATGTADRDVQRALARWTTELPRRRRLPVPGRRLALHRQRTARIRPRSPVTTPVTARASAAPPRCTARPHRGPPVSHARRPNSQAPPVTAANSG
jgi:hypothetical protein